MRFRTAEESIEAAATANAELQPRIVWAEKVVPCRLVGGKHVFGRKDPYTLYPHLVTLACVVPYSTTILVHSAESQIGLDVLNWIRLHYPRVKVTPRVVTVAPSANGKHKKKKAGKPTGDQPA